MKEAKGSEDAEPGCAGLQPGNPGNAKLDPGAPSPANRGWYSRGYMPHYDATCVIQHVTYHLADSLPTARRAQMEDELRGIPELTRDVARRKRIEAWLDAGHGCCILREPAAARLVQDAFLFFDGQRYRLLAWVVMPNHVHVLFQPLEGWGMATIVAAWKSFTGRRLAPLLPPSAMPLPEETLRVWQREYCDRFIRNERHLMAAREYIHHNPVKAGLVASPEDWPWSSVRAG